MDTDIAPTTLIVEPNPLGHRLYYVALILDECHSRGDRVVLLTTARAVDSAEWRIHIGRRDLETLLRPDDAFDLSEIAKLATRVGAASTILPEADHYLLPILRRGWRGPGELTVLVVRAEVQARPPLARMRVGKSFFKKVMIWAADLRPRVRVFALRSPLTNKRGPIRWIADPVALSCSSEQMTAMRARWDGGRPRYWLGVFGAISPRKNLPLIVEAILDQPDLGLLIAGTVDPEVMAAAQPLVDQFIADGGSVIRLSGPLSEAEFDSAIGAVDCVVVAHSNEGPSGIVIKAAASGTRLILAGAKSLREDATNLRGLATWSTLDVYALRKAIQDARLSPRPAPVGDLGSSDFVSALT